MWAFASSLPTPGLLDLAEHNFRVTVIAAQVNAFSMSKSNVSGWFKWMLATPPALDAEVRSAYFFVVHEFRAGPAQDDPASFDYIRPIRDRQGLEGVLLDEQDRDPL